MLFGMVLAYILIKYLLCYQNVQDCASRTSRMIQVDNNHDVEIDNMQYYPPNRRKL